MVEFLLQIRMGAVDNRQNLYSHLGALADGTYMVSIKEANRRSNNQNAYIHAVLFPEVRKALRNLGWDEIRTIEHAKMVCKANFLKEEIVNKETGEVVTMIKDTSQLTRGEMAAFIDQVIRWAQTDLNWQILPPNSQAQAF